MTIKGLDCLDCDDEIKISEKENSKENIINDNNEIIENKTDSLAVKKVLKKKNKHVKEGKNGLEIN